MDDLGAYLQLPFKGDDRGGEGVDEDLSGVVLPVSSVISELAVEDDVVGREGMAESESKRCEIESLVDSDVGHTSGVSIAKSVYSE